MMNLKEEFIHRFLKDQQLIRDKKISEFEAYCIESSKWLKLVIKEHGWPIAEKFGFESEQGAWLIAQHSSDLEFQKLCLELMKKLPETPYRKQSIAYLTDRILTKEGKRQMYGTQFENGKSFPIHDIKNLDKLRLEMGLEPFEEYAKIMKIHNKQ